MDSELAPNGRQPADQADRLGPFIIVITQPCRKLIFILLSRRR